MPGSIDQGAATILENLRATRDSLSVKKVFGDPYEIDGTTVIPVARVSGGAGGGGGEGGADDAEGSGFGSGFGLNVTPMGVYEVRDGKVDWKPTVDVSRIARGGQVLGGIIAVCVTIVLSRRRR
jgi:uncharacterized spore protein YtfJ